MTPSGSYGSDPIELARFGSSEAESGLNGISLGILMSSAERALAMPGLAMSRQAMSPNSRRMVGPLDQGRQTDPFFNAEVVGAEAFAWSELIYFMAGGSVTAVGSAHARAGGALSPKPGLSGTWTHPDKETEYFEGRIRANPRFLPEDTEATEILLTFGSEQDRRWTYGMSALLMRAVRFVAKVSLDAQAPILFMQSPVSHYRRLPSGRRADGSTERVREPRAPVLRAAVGIDRRFPARRLEFVRAVESFAVEVGMGLEVKDRRPGMSRGDWFELCRPEEDVLKVERKSLSGTKEATAIRQARPLCIVGPARVGSTAACIDLLDAVGAGLCGVSISSLQDIAVINLVVPTQSRQTAVRTAAQAAAPTAAPAAAPTAEQPERIEDLGRLEDALIRVGRTASRTGTKAPMDSKPVLADAAADYLLVAGRRRELSQAGAENGRWALWASWEVPESGISPVELLQMIQKALTGAVSDVVSGRNRQVWIEYARSRLIDNSRLRGRAKFSIPQVVDPQHRTQTDVLNEICNRAEAACAAELFARISPGGPDADAPHHGDTVRSLVAGEVRISWREKWLGRLGEFIP